MSVRVIMTKSDEVYAGIGSDAVHAKTGKTWKE
jgi:hypothetical protein